MKRKSADSRVTRLEKRVGIRREPEIKFVVTIVDWEDPEYHEDETRKHGRVIWVRAPLSPAEKLELES